MNVFSSPLPFTPPRTQANIFMLNQQPTCEAFIMTGQSMMKLSCNESENTQSHSSKNNKPKVKSELSKNSLKNITASNTTASNNNEISNLNLSSSTSNNSIGSNASPNSSQETMMIKENKHIHNYKDQYKRQENEELPSSTITTTTSATITTYNNTDNNITEPTSTPTMTHTDRDSARRLAKRLYNLSGFKKSDVCHHLSKNNSFSQTVAEEYLKLFDFRTMKLDCALRKFLSKLQLNGETQERERILSQFSQRFYDCNKDRYHSADTVQTLVCALILLNTDLHGGHSKKKRAKLSLGAFIDGLNSSIASIDRLDSPNTTTNNVIILDNNNIKTSSLEVANHNKQQLNGNGLALNNSANNNIIIPNTFPRHLLVDLYESIKKRPLKCGDDKCDLTSFEAELDRIYNQQQLCNNYRSNTLPTRRFVPGSNAPSSTMSASSRRHLKQGLFELNSSSQQEDRFEATIEFKSGILNRKRIFEANRKPTIKGRRGWRRVHTSLKDLRLMMRHFTSDDEQSSSTSPSASLQSNKQKLELSKASVNSNITKSSRFRLLSQDLKNTVKIHHTFAWRSSTYTKREFVFHLRLADQSELLMQANNEHDLSNWIDTINFASACLSAPELPNAISNLNVRQRRNSLPASSTTRQIRPLLPVTYTRLSYWEQLINHEERLQRLKVELDEHIAKAPNTTSANKRSKTDYIEKIAYLKQEIERYTVYVDLMRKKSNSPEAIILSKHPQIASLTPSPEMISSFPVSFVPPPTSSSDADKNQAQELTTTTTAPLSNK